MEKISFAAGHEYTLASVQRDFVEWRKERTHYAVWAIDVDTPALRAATTALRTHLADNLLNGYRRQPHVTLHLCGFPSTSPSFDDDYPGTELQHQIAALQAAGPAPFTLEIGSPASFTSAAYFSVADHAGGIQASRHALAGSESPDDGFPYTPHVTCGLYRGEFHLPMLLQRMAACRSELPVQLEIERLSLMTYEAAVIGGPLTSLCEFDLASRQAKILDQPLTEQLFGKIRF